MLFDNSEIIRSNVDYMVGATNTKDEISYLGYMDAVENRILKLVVHAIKDSMADGASKTEAIADLCTFIYSKLSYLEKKYPTDAEGLTKEIMNSEEFLKWQYTIWVRFQNVHLGVIMKDTPIPAHGKLHPDIDADTVEIVEKEDSLQVLIDGLSGTNFHE